MEDAGREELQKYMDELQPAINAALNALAKERPAEPLKALAKLLDPEPAAPPPLRRPSSALPSAVRPLYEPLGPLRELMGHTGLELVERMHAEEVVHELLKAGALTEAAPPKPAALSARERWQHALKPALAQFKSHENAWSTHGIHKRPTELCKRWDYDAGRDSWSCSETLMKMEGEPFAKGAMRECYRMKKMSQINAHFFFAMAWEVSATCCSPSRSHSPRPSCDATASTTARRLPRPNGRVPRPMPTLLLPVAQDCNNYVAKRYMKADTLDKVYFNDIKMQMVSKRYARLYNAQGPPKGVDFLQASVPSSATNVSIPPFRRRWPRLIAAACSLGRRRPS